MDEEISIGKLRDAFGLTPEKGRDILKTVGGKTNFDNTQKPYKAKEDNFVGRCWECEREGEALVEKQTSIDSNFFKDTTGNIINWDFADDTVMDMVKKFRDRKMAMKRGDYWKEREKILNAAIGECPRDINEIHKDIHENIHNETRYLYEAVLDLCRVDKRSAVLQLSEEGMVHKRDVDGLTYAIFTQLCEEVPPEILVKYTKKIDELRNNKKTGDAKKLKAYLMRAQGCPYEVIAKRLDLAWNAKDADTEKTSRSNIRNKYVNKGKTVAVDLQLPDLSPWLPTSPSSASDPSQG